MSVNVMQKNGKTNHENVNEQSYKILDGAILSDYVGHIEIKKMGADHDVHKDHRLGK
jgi:hypothetical protein